jgi:hypothetical protein
MGWGGRGEAGEGERGITPARSLLDNDGYPVTILFLHFLSFLLPRFESVLQKVEDHRERRGNIKTGCREMWTSSLNFDFTALGIIAC